MIEWLKYVPHHAVEAHTKQGWVISDCLAETNHGHYSIIMQWPHEGEPPGETNVVPENLDAGKQSSAT